MHHRRHHPEHPLPRLEDALPGELVLHPRLQAGEQRRAFGLAESRTWSGGNEAASRVWELSGETVHWRVMGWSPQVGLEGDGAAVQTVSKVGERAARVAAVDGRRVGDRNGAGTVAREPTGDVQMRSVAGHAEHHSGMMRLSTQGELVSSIGRVLSAQVSGTSEMRSGEVVNVCREPQMGDGGRVQSALELLTEVAVEAGALPLHAGTQTETEGERMCALFFSGGMNVETTGTQTGSPVLRFDNDNGRPDRCHECCDGGGGGCDNCGGVFIRLGVATQTEWMLPDSP
jgi:hypothetical protein